MMTVRLTVSTAEPRGTEDGSWGEHSLREEDLGDTSRNACEVTFGFLWGPWGNLKDQGYLGSS